MDNKLKSGGPEFNKPRTSQSQTKKLLCISYRFPPETYPLASRVAYMLEHLETDWSIDAVTAAENAKAGTQVRIHHVPPRTPDGLIRWLKRIKMGKLVDLFFWPDRFVFWNKPAYKKALQLIRKEKPDLILVFMMPYSTGLMGMKLKKKTGIPVVFNLNDSPTCTDMNPSFPSRIHFKLAHWLEDKYAQTANEIIYVSGRNMERVRMRQPEQERKKFHLIRRGARPLHRNGSLADPKAFQIVYTGGMSGWYHFLDTGDKQSLPKRLFQTWQQLGRYKLVKLDHRSHSPVYIGQALKQLAEQHPEWASSLRIDVYGNTYPKHVIERVLKKFGIQDFVNIHPPVAHDEVRKHTLEADLLFMALPERVDGSPGGRISAKTYEYLMTDRHVLAAVPDGENREYLNDKPGIHLVGAKDIDAMAHVIGALAEEKFAGSPLMVDRAELQLTLTNTARALDFEQVLESALRS